VTAPDEYAGPVRECYTADGRPKRRYASRRDAKNAVRRARKNGVELGGPYRCPDCHRYWGGNFYGLRACDVALLRRYLRMWRRLDWFGLRSWLYAQGLHAAVHRKKPGACNAVPPHGHGGYDHWYCQRKRRHDGLHRVNSYVWGEIAGQPLGATYAPEEATR